jgi:hypothetical protein
MEIFSKLKNRIEEMVEEKKIAIEENIFLKIKRKF